LAGPHTRKQLAKPIPADGNGEPKPLTDFKTETIRFFARTADGKQLAIVRGTAAIDLVLLSEAK
jgi:hypothetical protein